MERERSEQRLEQLERSLLEMHKKVKMLELEKEELGKKASDNFDLRYQRLRNEMYSLQMENKQLRK